MTKLDQYWSYIKGENFLVYLPLLFSFPQSIFVIKNKALVRSDYEKLLSLTKMVYFIVIIDNINKN